MRRVFGFDHLVSVACFLFAAIYLWSSMSIVEGSFGDTLGPRVFPQIVGGLLLVLSIIMFVKGTASEKSDIPAVAAMMAIFGTILFVAAFVLLLPLIGFALSTFLLTLGFLLALREPLRVSLLYAASLAALFSVVFEFILATPFPKGFLGGLL